MTHEEMMAAEEEAKAVAAAFNQMDPTGGDTPEENAARAAAAELNKLEGNMDHSGNHSVRADTPEELEAAAAKKAEEEAAKAEDKTPEELEAEKAKAAAEAKSAEEDNTDDDPEDADEVEWMETDSRELNAVMAVLKGAGVTAAEADALFGEALTTGDINRVDRAAMVEKIGEAQTDLIMGGVARFVEAEGEALLARTKAVHDAAGGSDAWLEAVQWARGKAKGDAGFAKQVEGITKLINGDDEFTATMAVEKFVAMYNADPKNSTLGAKEAVATPHGKTAAEAVSKAEPLTAREYAEAVDHAQRNKRGADLSAELAKLSKGRAAGRSKGI